MPDYRSWLRKGLEKDGVTTATVAAALETHRSAIYKLLDGNREFRADEIPKIAKAINEPIPLGEESALMISGTLLVPVIYGISADWAPPKKIKEKGCSTVVLRTGKFKNASPLAYRFEGACIPGAKVAPGDDIVCLDYAVVSDVERFEPGTLLVVRKERKISLREVVEHSETIQIQSLTDNCERSVIDRGTRIVAVAKQACRSL